VGRIGKEKNIVFLLKAFLISPARKRMRYWCWLAAGQRKRRCVRWQRIWIKDRVILTGRIPPELISGVYKSADIFVFPSVTETQGLVLVEAMAAGLPVVAKAAFGSLAMVRDG